VAQGARHTTETCDDGKYVRQLKQGGVVRPGDTIKAELPSGPHRPLEGV
jgi:MOSC domain-containing protein YiiM